MEFSEKNPGDCYKESVYTGKYLVASQIIIGPEQKKMDKFNFFPEKNILVNCNKEAVHKILTSYCH